MTATVRKDSTLVAPEDAKEDKDGDVPPYKAYTFKAQAETEIQIKSPDALKDDFPELVVTEGKWYSVLEEDDKTPSESAEEKTETETETENKAETEIENKAETTYFKTKYQSYRCRITQW